MRGFTLIEVLVSVAIFSFVMVIALGSLLAISTSDRKAESLKAVINNLSFSLDSMSRSVRTGYDWGCNTVAGTDCASPGANEIVFTSSGNVVTYYKLESLLSDPTNAAAVCNQTAPHVGCVVTSTDGITWYPITAPEVVISDFSGNTPASYMFYLVGSAPGPDTTQPKLVITLTGYVSVSGGVSSQIQCGTLGNQCTIFRLQTTATQRVYDQ